MKEEVAEGEVKEEAAEAGAKEEAAEVGAEIPLPQAQYVVIRSDLAHLETL